ncbi:hypothetical protein [Paenibacillus aceti]|uniref:Uncharacterized protein n=1 Tax=Paenibacillus aceti TaxID=1820010 RepID=A0ABQ1W0B5_9BACL|nr:hypothetical protein [Paenibacillus aceti]GGG08564.1 hypothetical protein GCM10010913_32900 [Paenibacillus aceti]
MEFTELVEELREKARSQRFANLKKGEEVPESPALGARELRGKIARTLAERAGIGKSSMEYLIAVQRDEPGLFERVKSGEITIN